jgi:hypothetical protein
VSRRRESSDVHGLDDGVSHALLRLRASAQLISTAVSTLKAAVIATSGSRVLVMMVLMELPHQRVSLLVLLIC